MLSLSARAHTELKRDTESQLRNGFLGNVLGESSFGLLKMLRIKLFFLIDLRAPASARFLPIGQSFAVILPNNPMERYQESV